MVKPRILIAGAGPSGLMMAVELARRGFMPIVIEKRSNASNLSRAVGILPRSMDLFAASGVDEPIRKEAIAYQSIIFHTNHKQIAKIPIDQIHGANNRIFGLAQNRTEAHLINKFKALGGKINYGAELLSLSQSSGGISVSIAGKAFGFDYVIGADGVNSAVRRALGISFKGYDLSETWSIADVQAQNWPNSQCFQSFLLDHGGVVVAPLENDRFRLVSNRPDALTALPVHMDIIKIHRAAEFKVSIRQAEQYQKDNVFLIGDAAHCHSPVGGRGMNLGIADAAELAERIAIGTSDGYHAVRHPEGRRTIRLSERARRMITARHPARRYLLRSGLLLVSKCRPVREWAAKRALDISN